MNTNDVMKLLQKCYDVKDKRILELGPLSGEHTKDLLSMGAKEVVAIEGRKENFDMCMKKLLFNTIFIYSDVENIYYEGLGHFDLCVASKILYHLTKPIKTIRNIAKVVDNIYIFYRVATKDCPDGEEVIIDNYKGRLCNEGDSMFSGLEDYSIWLYKEDLLRLLNDVGFINVIITEGKEQSFIPNIQCDYVVLLSFKGDKK